LYLKTINKDNSITNNYINILSKENQIDDVSINKIEDSVDSAIPIDSAITIDSETDNTESSDYDDVDTEADSDSDNINLNDKIHLKEIISKKGYTRSYKFNNRVKRPIENVIGKKKIYKY